MKVQKRITWYFVIFLFVVLIQNAGSYVLRDGNRTYIVDRTGEKWDVTQAKAIGFEARHFRFGLGRHAFSPLGESNWQPGRVKGMSSLRVIGVSNGKDAHAYSVRKLSRHETANTILANEAIAAAY
jgi:hypothetical protein